MIEVGRDARLTVGLRSVPYRPSAVAPPAVRRRLSCAERASAAAGRLRVRVVEHEPLGQQSGVVVERRPVEKEQALAIDENPGAFRTLEHLVAGARLALPTERIAQA